MGWTRDEMAAIAASRPMPDAAPVTSARRPSW